METKESQEALGQRLIEEAGGGYLRYRVLKDGSLAILCRLAFTKAIMVGVEEVNPYKRRFCFEDFELAENQFDILEDELQVLTGSLPLVHRVLSVLPLMRSSGTRTSSGWLRTVLSKPKR